MLHLWYEKKTKNTFKKSLVCPKVCGLSINDD